MTPVLRSANASIVTGAVSTMIGIVVLIGYATQTDILYTGIPGATIMLPITAVSFFLGGAALLLDAASVRGLSAKYTGLASGAAAVLLAATGAVMAFQRLSGTEIASLDGALFGSFLARYPYRPIGLMATNSAICIVLSGLTLVSLRFHNAQSTRFRELFGLATLLTSSLALLGYLYGTSSLYKFDSRAAMAPFTVFGFLNLSMGILLARPYEGTASLLTGGSAAAVQGRRLLAATVAVPVLLGALWLQALRFEDLSHELGVALFVVLTALTIGVAVLLSARALRRSDSIREAARADAEIARANAMQAKQEAEAANKAKSDFLAMMSHELRTPLNAIRGYASLLQMEIPGPLTPEQRDHLTRIQKSDSRLLSMIEDLLGYAQVESGKLNFTVREVPLSSLIEEALLLITPRAAGSQVEIATSLEKTTMNVCCDRHRMIQIVVNLVVNAVKFSPPGGTVSLDARETNVHGQRFVELEVRDSGKGIPPDKLELIFEPFVQVESGFTRNSEGVGLGLAISRSLARGMGGDITVSSEEGRGASFVVRMPAAPAGLDVMPTPVPLLPLQSDLISTPSV